MTLQSPDTELVALLLYVFICKLALTLRFAISAIFMITLEKNDRGIRYIPIPCGMHNVKCTL